ncbi:MAG: DNA alkylation repair protein [Candidatus Avelusimicrobium sp.]
MFKFLDNQHIDQVFKILDNFKTEQHYYVNMANAWLLCECFIKQREKTLNYLKNHNLNNFTINKTISKCRDSFRVSKEDKEMLLTFKQSTT